ncbi:MAG: BON domain-containing protein, partial [Pyrinomonadaceae bacterium]|nr:BON domain-containing protein [Pyrinomonadaceae bacterium]
RSNFVRPTYWEEPLPSAPEKNLPPAELARLHFQRIRAANRDTQRGAAAALDVFWEKRKRTRTASALTSIDEVAASDAETLLDVACPPDAPVDPVTRDAATAPAAELLNAYGAPPASARKSRAPLYAGLMTAVVAVFLVGVSMNVWLGSSSVMNANANVNVNPSPSPAVNVNTVTNANLTREEYERDRARYEREAREAGRTIGRGANDPWLWTKTRAALLAADDLRDFTIDVDVENDVVTLSGLVVNQSQKTRAGRIAQRIEGVRSVRNNLTVSAGGGTNINTNANTNANAHRNANPKS